MLRCSGVNAHWKQRLSTRKSAWKRNSRKSSRVSLTCLNSGRGCGDDARFAAAGLFSASRGIFHAALDGPRHQGGRPFGRIRRAFLFGWGRMRDSNRGRTSVFGRNRGLSRKDRTVDAVGAAERDSVWRPHRNAGDAAGAPGGSRFAGPRDRRFGEADRRAAELSCAGIPAAARRGAVAAGTRADSRATAADLTVLALVGERGREVREFLEDAIGAEGLARSTVVVSTSDQSPLLRIRAALVATTVAEYFAAHGKHVLLVVDSLTRFAMAQREIGLAAGEPPTAKGYTPSVFTWLARLIERAGNFSAGSTTAFYTVLMEGDDQQDPLVDAVRALLDGHVMLDRKLNAQGHYPPIAILDSLSRLMSAVCSAEHLEKARRIRQLLAAYAASEDLIRVGAYQKGADPTRDRAISALPAINGFLQQRKTENSPFADTVKALQALPA